MENLRERAVRTCQESMERANSVTEKSKALLMALDELGVDTKHLDLEVTGDEKPNVYATVDGLTFTVRTGRDGELLLRVVTRCPICGQDTYHVVSDLRMLGAILMDGYCKGTTADTCGTCRDNAAKDVWKAIPNGWSEDQAEAYKELKHLLKLNAVTGDTSPSLLCRMFIGEDLHPDPALMLGDHPRYRVMALNPPHIVKCWPDDGLWTAQKYCDVANWLVRLKATLRNLPESGPVDLMD